MRFPECDSPPDTKTANFFRSLHLEPSAQWLSLRITIPPLSQPGTISTSRRIYRETLHLATDVKCIYCRVIRAAHCVKFVRSGEESIGKNGTSSFQYLIAVFEKCA